MYLDKFCIFSGRLLGGWGEGGMGRWVILVFYVCEECLFSF